MIHISLAAEPLFSIGSFIVTNALLTSIIGSILIFTLLFIAARRVTMFPTNRWSQMVETLFEALFSLIDQMTQDRKKTVRFFPFLMTLFLFIVVNNWIGLLPGVGSITIETSEGIVPLFRGANADLNATIALALISVIMTHIYAVRELGIITHLKKYFSLNPLFSFIGLLEIVSEFSKIISFSFRLFGNIFAGEVLLIVIAYLAPILGPLPFFGLELFVGLVQGLVFTLLTLVFLVIATSSHSQGDETSHKTNEKSSRTPQLVEGVH
jgi:F-type H+-transporting ATPase subunit a